MTLPNMHVSEYEWRSVAATMWRFGMLALVVACHHTELSLWCWEGVGVRVRRCRAFAAVSGH